MNNNKDKEIVEKFANDMRGFLDWIIEFGDISEEDFVEEDFVEEDFVEENFMDTKETES